MDDTIFRLISISISLIIGVFTLLAVGGAVLILNNAVNGWKKRVPVYERLARETGLMYSSGEPLSNVHGAEYFRLFNLGSKYNRQIQNLVRGTIDNFQVSIFDYTYSVTFSYRKYFRQTVVMIESARIGVPLFSMRPRPRGFLEKMNFAANNTVEFAQDANFSGRYELFGRDEPRVRQLFNERVRNFLGATENLNLEGGGSRFLFYFDGRLVAPEQLRPMLEESLKAVGLFGF